MRIRVIGLLALALFSYLPSLSCGAAYLRVVSWNLRHEGYSGETDYSGDAAQIWNQYGSSGTSANGCDAVFCQEVMYASAAQGIASALTSISGVSWTYSVTPAIGRTSYKEMYAVIYRTDNVALLSSTVWSDTGDKFEREPQIVKLRDKRTNADFTFINWHTTWGTTAERQAEIQEIDGVFASIQNGSTTDQDVILLGDHNCDATSTWWAQLKALSPAVSNKVNDLTTINSAGAYASAYDHFWFQTIYVTEFSSAGRDYIASTTSFYSNLSDHAPVWLKLYSSSDTD